MARGNERSAASRFRSISRPRYFFFLPFAWVKADLATLFSAFVDLGSARIRPAFEATRLDVSSLLDMLGVSR